jgi:effector-binding domain-containing protein
MGYEIEVADGVPAQPTAVVALATTWPDLPAAAGAAFDEVWAFLRSEAGEGLRTDGHNVMYYLDGVPNVEVGVIVAGGFAPCGRVRPSALPGGRVARTVHRGSYEHLAEAHNAVRRWCEDNGYEVAGPRWEVYGDWHEDETRLETEVAWQL